MLKKKEVSQTVQGKRGVVTTKVYIRSTSHYIFWEMFIKFWFYLYKFECIIAQVSEITLCDVRMVLDGGYTNKKIIHKHSSFVSYAVQFPKLLLHTMNILEYRGHETRWEIFHYFCKTMDFT